MRIAQSLYGDVEVPAAPQRVFAFDEYSGAVLLAAGIEPVGAFSQYFAQLPQQILSDAGVDVQEATYGSWNYEAIATYEPDMIVMIDVDEQVAGALSDIAPTVVLPFTGALWRDALAAIGEATGDTSQATSIAAGIEARIDDIAAGLDDETVLSLLGSGPLFGTYSLGIDVPTGAVIDEAGFTRPAAQQTEATLGALTQLSPEQLGDHDGDVVVIFAGDESWADRPTLEGLPTFGVLPAVTDGRVVEVLGEVWTNSDPFSIFWAVEDLAAIAAGESPGTLDDLDTRWSDYLALATS
ncbi:MAG: ABC transporter substrate-binding protein [Actinomycetota bacterium]